MIVPNIYSNLFKSIDLSIHKERHDIEFGKDTVFGAFKALDINFKNSRNSLKQSTIISLFEGLDQIKTMGFLIKH